MDNENYYQNENENRTTPEEQNYEQPNYEQPNYEQPNYEQPKYEQPRYEQPQGNEPIYSYQPYIAPNQPEKKKNGIGIASLVIGIISLISCCCWWLSIILGVASIILGIISLVQKETTKGFAITGIILGAMGIILAAALVLTAVYMSENGMLDQVGRYYYDEYGFNPFENIN